MSVRTAPTLTVWKVQGPNWKVSTVGGLLGGRGEPGVLGMSEIGRLQVNQGFLTFIAFPRFNKNRLNWWENIPFIS